jgi:hypothetical protein
MSRTQTVDIGRRAFLRAVAAGAALGGASGLLSACGVATPAVPDAPVLATAVAAPVATATISAAQTITLSYYDTSIQTLIDALSRPTPVSG